MFEEITSIDFKKYIGKIRVEFKYWIDENNKWWYCYDDITTILELSARAADKLLSEYILEDEKIIYEDRNTYNECYDNNVIQARQFISSEAVHRLVHRNNERNNRLIKTINNLESDFKSNELYDDNVRDLCDSLATTISNGKFQNFYDYEEVFAQAYELVQTPTAQDILDKVGKIDKEKEELVYEFRDYIYDDYYDEIEINVHLSKRKDCESDEERELRYKKNKNIASTMPSWLKDVVK